MENELHSADMHLLSYASDTPCIEERSGLGRSFLHRWLETTTCIGGMHFRHTMETSVCMPKMHAAHWAQSYSFSISRPSY
jgi:hypothetical protein